MSPRKQWSARPSRSNKSLCSSRSHDGKDECRDVCFRARAHQKYLCCGAGYLLHVFRAVASCIMLPACVSAHAAARIELDAGCRLVVFPRTVSLIIFFRSICFVLVSEISVTMYHMLDAWLIKVNKLVRTCTMGVRGRKQTE